MTATLRPMNLGEILDRTFQIYRARFWVFLGIAALPAVGMLGVHLADVLWFHTRSLLSPFRQPGIFLWQAALSIRFYHISGFLGLLFMPAYVHVVAGTSMDEKASVRSALRFAAMRWKNYLWLAFLKISAQLIVPEILAFTATAVLGFILNLKGFLDGGREFVAVPLLLLPALLAFGLFLGIGACLSLAVPASALEQLPGFKSLRRSWELTKGSRWRITATFVALAIFSWVLMYCLQFAFRVVWIFLYREHLLWMATQHAYSVEVELIFAAASTLLGPIFPIAMTLFYYDQRIRLEGYDIECMMKAAGMEHGAAGKSEASLGSASANSLRVASAAQDALIDGEGQA